MQFIFIISIHHSNPYMEKAPYKQTGDFIVETCIFETTAEINITI